MGSTKENNDFMPKIAVPPGETIKENMEYLGMNQDELSTRLGITQKHLSNILKGKSPITYETALNLEKVIGPSANFWMNLEMNYQLAKHRLEKDESIEQDLETLKKIPYKEMSEYGWVEYTTKRYEKVINLRTFFGVSNLKLIMPSCNVGFRQHQPKNQISNYGVLAWLRKAELEALSIKVDRINRKRLKKLIPTFRRLTLKDPEEFYPKLQQLCAQCGIALVLVESLPKTYICGATIWKKDKGILALSVRGKKADIFWFTFFHELAHILNHKGKEFHINFENSKNEEDEANRLARNYLIPDEVYNDFVSNYLYKDKGVITAFAKEIGIAPSILVGRLLHDKLIDYRYYNDLRPSFEIVREDSINSS